MRVDEILRRKGEFVATVTPDATIADMLATMTRHNIGAVVVSGDATSVVGIASERDVVRMLAERGEQILDEPVSALMTSDVRTVSPHDDVETLARLMTDERIRHVPAVDGGRLVGIVSIGDVVKSRIDQLETERSSLIGYITASG